MNNSSGIEYFFGKKQNVRMALYALGTALQSGF